jgi:hypothetical protein
VALAARCAISSRFAARRARLLHLFQLGGDQQFFDQTAEVGLHRCARRVRIAGTQTFDSYLVFIIQGGVTDFPRSF